MKMSTVTDIGSLITQIPGVCGGRPHTASSCLSVRRIAGWYRMGHTPEEIADQYGHLSLAQVYAALAFYHANQDAIDRELADERAEYDRLAATHGSKNVDSP